VQVGRCLGGYMEYLQPRRGPTQPPLTSCMWVSRSICPVPLPPGRTAKAHAHLTRKEGDEDDTNLGMKPYRYEGGSVIPHSRALRRAVGGGLCATG
jgi:hypothetical protein